MASRKAKTICGLIAIVFLSVTMIGTPYPPKGNSTAYASEQPSSAVNETGSGGLRSRLSPGGTEPFYEELRGQWDKEAIPPAQAAVEIKADRWLSKSDRAEAGSYKGQDGALLLGQSGGWVEYEVDVPQEGLYELHATYDPIVAEKSGGLQRIVLAVEINGSYPFVEARSMTLERTFRDRQPIKFDDEGNQMRSLIEETSTWSTGPLRDTNGAYAEPLLWHLKQGKNTIRLESMLQPVALGAILLKPKERIPTYQEFHAGIPDSAVRNNESVIEIEAEQFSSKNASSIQVQYNRDPMTTPESLNAIRFNTAGGWSWYKGGQAVTWEIDIPEDGLYKLGMRANQNFRSNLTVFRTISIDGKVPFQEMMNYPFPYSSGWQGATLQDAEGNPYEFYLAKGRHTLRMEANYERYMPLLVQIEGMLDEFKAISSDLRTATGNREDRYRVWDVENDIPGITDRLRTLASQLNQLSDRMIGINGKADSVSQSFLSSAKDIEDLLDDPNEIPASQLTIGTLQEKLINQRKDLMDSPLELDRIAVVPAGGEFPRMTANWWEKLKGMLSSLLYSFDARNSISKQKNDEINVWMFWGRDYVNELQQLADEQFTPKYGVKVRINLVQSSELLILGNAAGIIPDVALGVPSGMPFELAVRHAAYDLTKLPGADDLLKRYSPGTLTPYYYEGGYYAVPETMNFKVLFYRKDILKQLGLSVPNTWDDVYDMLPTLLQNEYNFYVEPGDYSYLFMQNGAELYTPDGLSTAINEPEAFDAFKRWTDLFNKHGLEQQVQSFYNQFRKGTIPIGISDFNQYMQLLVAAPEIMEDWAIAPVPGTVQKDGSIARWIGGSQSVSSMMFKGSSDQKRDLAWQFLQWYLSDETQTEFGLNLEQYSGETFRWNSSSVKAFANMPWKQEDLHVFMEQWKWMREFPNVPGGYMSGRELGFAWNRAVIDGETPRISLEKAEREINRELIRKQREFHIKSEDGSVLKTLDLPQMAEPWKGADPYVK